MHVPTAGIFSVCVWFSLSLPDFAYTCMCAWSFGAQNGTKRAHNDGVWLVDYIFDGKKRTSAPQPLLHCFHRTEFPWSRALFLPCSLDLSKCLSVKEENRAAKYDATRHNRVSQERETLILILQFFLSYSDAYSTSLTCISQRDSPPFLNTFWALTFAHFPLLSSPHLNTRRETLPIERRQTVCMIRLLLLHLFALFSVRSASPFVFCSHTQSERIWSRKSAGHVFLDPAFSSSSSSSCWTTIDWSSQNLRSWLKHRTWIVGRRFWVLDDLRASPSLPLTPFRHVCDHRFYYPFSRVILDADPDPPTAILRIFFYTFMKGNTIEWLYAVFVGRIVHGVDLLLLSFSHS